jgi:hypothetical protein
LLSFCAESFVFQFTIENIEVKLYRTIILPFVLYGCESWSLTLREECRLRVFKNRVLRRIFGPKRDEVTQKFYVLYTLPNIILVIKSRRLRWAWHVTCMGERRGAYRLLMGKPGERRPLARQRLRWEDNIKMGLQKVGLEGMDWIDQAQDRDTCRLL